MSPTLVFRVGANLYGCDILEAREIIPLRASTRLPGAPPFVRGLINIRGTIVTVLDLGQRLDPKRGPTKTGSILLVRYADRMVGFVVDRVEDVRVLSSVVEGADAGVKGGAAGIVRGVATSNETTVVILDLPALIKQVLLS
ncbi:MAG TPA: chemotaxis protein CheW [Gemmatimonadaceae bacterium]